MRRRLFTANRVPNHIAQDVRDDIRIESWRALRRSPRFWMTLTVATVLAFAAEAILFWITAGLGDTVQNLMVALALAVYLGLVNFASNWGQERTRREIWLAHGVCPDCGYDLTGNTSGVCPECGAACKAADPAGVSPAAGD